MRNVCLALVAKMPIARYKKVHELLCMQLLQGIVFGHADCECKEGCKGDPFTKCDCSGNIFILDHLQNSKLAKLSLLMAVFDLSHRRKPTHLLVEIGNIEEVVHSCKSNLGSVTEYT